MVLFISSMMQIIIIEKDGNMKYGVIKELPDLYKKCGFRKSEGFSQITTWKKTDIVVELWGRVEGKNNVKNCYEFPKNVVKQIYGNCCVIAKSKNMLINIDEDLWKKMSNNFTQDDNDKNENDNDDKTDTDKEEVLDYSSDDSSSSEDSFMDSELKEESYIYSDEEEKEDKK